MSKAVPRLDERCAAIGRAAEVAIILQHDHQQHKTCRFNVFEYCKWVCYARPRPIKRSAPCPR